jgi:hypothetical protein
MPPLACSGGFIASLHHRDDANDGTTARPDDPNLFVVESGDANPPLLAPQGDGVVQIGRPSNMRWPSRKSSWRASKTARRFTSYQSNSISYV